MGAALGRATRLAAVAFGAAIMLVLLIPGAALAKTSSSSYIYGPDSANWYWKDQVEQTVGAGPVAQIVTLGNPQASDTLPVAAQNGQADKVSAVGFDLSRRGVVAGSVLDKFTLTIAENDDLMAGFVDPTQPDIQPSFNTEGKLIQACPIITVWSSGEGAELWERAPSYDTTLCVQGKRIASGQTVSWSFDLTALAKEWATDPVSNRGMMLAPVIPEGGTPNDSTWQINLKIPHRDEDSTSGTDEYEQTKDRVKLDLAFTPPSGSQSDNNFTGGGTNFGFPGTGGQGASNGTDFPFGSSPISPGSSGTTPPGGEQRASSNRPSPTVPQLPWYVWALIPLGLLAVSTVRAVVLEPIATGKPGGVIAAIRTKNAELTGKGSRGGGAGTGRTPRRFPALISLGALGRQGFESVSTMTSRARRALRRR
jgi:hypothetical protein